MSTETVEMATLQAATLGLALMVFVARGKLNAIDALYIQLLVAVFNVLALWVRVDTTQLMRYAVGVIGIPVLHFIMTHISEPKGSNAGTPKNNGETGPSDTNEQSEEEESETDDDNGGGAAVETNPFMPVPPQARVCKPVRTASGGFGRGGSNEYP